MYEKENWVKWWENDAERGENSQKRKKRDKATAWDQTREIHSYYCVKSLGESLLVHRIDHCPLVATCVDMDICIIIICIVYFKNTWQSRKIKCELQSIISIIIIFNGWK